jgi:hypothetical protein
LFELDLFFHPVTHFSTATTLSVSVAVSNGDEVIPNSKAFLQSFTVSEVPDMVVFTNDLTATTTVFQHQFTPIAGLQVTDVDPVRRDLLVDLATNDNTVIK